MPSVFLNGRTIDRFKKKILAALNDGFSDLHINASPRTVGDRAQEVIEGLFAKGLPVAVGKAIQEKFARRAMADVAFTDTHKNYIVVDVKTHNEDTDFNMPNLTSVERLARFYEDDSNCFAVMIAKYGTKGATPKFNNLIFIPIEHLNWDCLTLGALGWGQIQIANARIININPRQTRKQWMLKLCDALDIFYPREIEKINDRIKRFKDIRAFWEKK